MKNQTGSEKLIKTPNGDIIIRAALEADANDYRNLRLKALHDHPEAFSSDYEVNLSRPMNYWTERIRALGNDGAIYFAETNNTLVGMCGIYRGDSPKTRHSAYIVSVYVKPEWRGLKIADGMVETCLEWARSQGITIAKLGVAISNIAAIKRYSDLGFKVYGIEPQANYSNGVMVDELLMALNL